MSQPKRIQRKRSKGWEMPENAVYIGRPGYFGNPFIIGHYYAFLDTQLFILPAPPDNFGAKYFTQIRDAAQATALYRELYFDRPRIDTIYKGGIPVHFDRLVSIKVIERKLQGKDLACWCRPDQPCHGDVLLEIANGAKAAPDETEVISALCSPWGRSQA